MPTGLLLTVPPAEAFTAKPVLPETAVLWTASALAIPSSASACARVSSVAPPPQATSAPANAKCNNVKARDLQFNLIM